MIRVVFSSGSSVLKYCSQRLNPKVMKAIIKANTYRLDTPEVDEHLGQATYAPVLAAVWAEGDKKRRLAWLRKNADLHPPLMFELALAEFEASPSVETVVKVAVPLIQAATFRAHQDASCLKFKKSRALEEEMNKIYQALLKDALERCSPSLSLTCILQTYEDEIYCHVNKQLTKIAARTLNEPNTLPSPVWVSYQHGGAICPMISKEAFTSARQEIVRKELF